MPENIRKPENNQERQKSNQESTQATKNFQVHRKPYHRLHQVSETPNSELRTQKPGQVRK